MATAKDEVILAEGETRGAIVVTLDSDFHALLALSNASSPSVIRIRTQGLKGEGVAEVIQPVVVAVEADLMAGVAVTVNDRRLATRRLPLITNAGEADDISNG